MHSSRCVLESQVAIPERWSVEEMQAQAGVSVVVACRHATGMHVLVLVLVLVQVPSSASTTGKY